MLKALAVKREIVDVAAIAEKARAEFAQSLTARLMAMLGDGVAATAPTLPAPVATTAASPVAAAVPRLPSLPGLQRAHRWRGCHTVI